MSLPPIDISELDPAGSVNPTADYLVIRQGLTDRRATPAQVAVISLQTLALLGTPVATDDVLLLGRPDGFGGYINYRIAPQRVGFYAGTIAWFYCTSATNSRPLGWNYVPGTGDRVIATGLQEGSSTYRYVGGAQTAGDWQQGDVNGTPGQGLSLTQIPNHHHWYMAGGQLASNPESVSAIAASRSRYGTASLNAENRGVVGGFADATPGDHMTYGGCDPHNHGFRWRPAALLGIICEKVD